jgi:hypothetical protein
VTSDEGYYQVSELSGRGVFRGTPSLRGYVFNPSARSIKNMQGGRRMISAPSPVTSLYHRTASHFPQPEAVAV